MATDVPIERSRTRTVSHPHGYLALAGLAATAGVIHFVATVEHIGEDWELGLFFALIGGGQLAAAWRIYRNDAGERLLKLVALGSLGVALLWVFSRTTGIWVGPESGRSKVGVGDTIATLWEVAFAAIVGLIVWRGERAAAWLTGAIGSRLVFAVLSLSLMMAAFGGHEH